MKSSILCAGFLALSGLLTSAAPDQPAGGPTYIIPIEGMIERGLVYVVRRAVKEAVREKAGVVILHMDTPGGRVDAAEEIINTIAGVPIRTCTYVAPNAISAGAIIAMATDEIYMAPGSRIGDAMPIMMTPFGAPQDMPEAIEEKTVSYVASLIRSTAQRKGHDPQLAEAMVRRQMEYKIGDEVISPANQLLTLTNVEAERVVSRDGRDEPLLSRGTVATMDDLIETIGQSGSDIRRVTITPAEQVARYIELLSVVFLAGGLLGLYIEFKTPGFGLPGIVGILLLGIWFWGHHIAGLAGMGELTLFLLGVILLMIEIFAIPGFGLVGTAGLTLIALSILMAMVEHYPGGPWVPPVRHMEHAVQWFGVALLLTFAMAVLLGRFLPKTTVFQHLMLASDVGSAKGYTASAATPGLVGVTGTAVTPLRPGGIGVFDGQRLSVVARGSFMEPGASIVIAETHGNRIVVDECVKPLRDNVAAAKG